MLTSVSEALINVVKKQILSSKQHFLHFWEINHTNSIN